MAHAPVETGTATIDGAELYYEVRGDGPPVVLVPGGGGDGGCFEPIVDRLAETHTPTP